MEAPQADATMLTVVLQQTLSYIHERGDASRAELARLVRSATPFERLKPGSNDALLDHLCAEPTALLYETRDGKFVLAAKGERLLQSHEIYAVFQGTLSWEVWSKDEHIGDLARAMPIMQGESFFLAGRRWTTTSVQPSRNKVIVEPAPDGSAPYFNISGEEEIDEALAREMCRVLQAGPEVPADCDRTAATYLKQGRAAYEKASLDSLSIVEDGDKCHLVTWKRTRFNSLLAVLLRFRRFACDNCEVAASVSNATSAEITDVLSLPLPSLNELSNFLESIEVGKFDKWITERLLREDWGACHRDLEGDIKEYCGSVRFEPSL